MNEERESFESTRSCFDLPLRSHPSIHLTDLLPTGGGLIYNDTSGESPNRPARSILLPLSHLGGGKAEIVYQNCQFYELTTLI